MFVCGDDSKIMVKVLNCSLMELSREDVVAMYKESLYGLRRGRFNG